MFAALNTVEPVQSPRRVALPLGDHIRFTPLSGGNGDQKKRHALIKFHQLIRQFTRTFGSVVEATAPHGQRFMKEPTKPTKVIPSVLSVIVWGCGPSAGRHRGETMTTLEY
jgi:hypothetical protein